VDSFSQAQFEEVERLRTSKSSRDITKKAADGFFLPSNTVARVIECTGNGGGNGGECEPKGCGRKKRSVTIFWRGNGITEPGTDSVEIRIIKLQPNLRAGEGPPRVAG